MADEVEIPGVTTTTVNTQTTITNLDLIDEKKVEEAKKKAQDFQDSLVKAKDMNSGGQRICQRCGHDTTVDVIIVTDADKKAFLSSVLGSIPYEKQFKVLGDNVEMIFKSPDSWYTNLLREQLIVDNRQRVVTTAEEYKLMMYKYYMLGSLHKLSIGGVSKYTIDIEKILNVANLKKRADDTGNTVLPKLLDEMTSLWSDVVLTAALETQVRFLEEVNVLTKHASDPAFWKSVNIG